jgi:hypothetical protein
MPTGRASALALEPGPARRWCCYACGESDTQAQRSMIKCLIRTIPHYSRPGVMCRDITTLLKDPVGSA